MHGYTKRRYINYSSLMKAYDQSGSLIWLVQLSIKGIKEIFP